MEVQLECLHSFLDMSKKLAAQLIALGCVGGGSYLAGSFAEKRRANLHRNIAADTDYYIFHVGDNVMHSKTE